MFKVILKPKSGYAEESQPNPLTWHILRQQSADLFENVSAPIICKDFFNDLAYTLQTGKTFTIYEFNAGSFKLEADKPIYMLLTQTTPQFVDNMVNVLTPWLASQGMPIVPMHKADNGYVIEFSPKYFKNTYNISLISLIIRLLNIQHSFSEFADVINYKKFPAKDQNKWDKVVKKNVYFGLPEWAKTYVWYCGPDFNSKSGMREYQVSSAVHNNGVLDWSQYL